MICVPFATGNGILGLHGIRAPCVWLVPCTGRIGTAYYSSTLYRNAPYVPKFSCSNSTVGIDESSWSSRFTLEACMIRGTSEVIRYRRNGVSPLSPIPRYPSEIKTSAPTASTSAHTTWTLKSQNLTTNQVWSVAVFLLAGLCEIGGGWLVWQAIRENKSR